MQNRKLIKFEIIEEISILSDDGKYRLELNRVKWGDHDTKYDIRKWGKNHSIVGRGITLTEEEMNALRGALHE